MHVASKKLAVKWHKANPKNFFETLLYEQEIYHAHQVTSYLKAILYQLCSF